MALLIFFLDLLWVFPRNVRNFCSFETIQKFPRIVNFLPSLEFHSNLCSLKGFCVTTSPLTSTRQTTDHQMCWEQNYISPNKYLCSFSFPLCISQVTQMSSLSLPDPCLYLQCEILEDASEDHCGSHISTSNPLCWVLTVFSFTLH